MPRPTNPLHQGMTPQEKKNARAQIWQSKNREHYREYQRDYQKQYIRDPRKILARLKLKLIKLQLKMDVIDSSLDTMNIRHQMKIKPQLIAKQVLQDQIAIMQKQVDDEQSIIQQGKQ